MLILIVLYSFCVLNFLPACIPNFARLAHTTQKVVQTCLYCSFTILWCASIAKVLKHLYKP